VRAGVISRGQARGSGAAVDFLASDVSAGASTSEAVPTLAISPMKAMKAMRSIENAFIDSAEVSGSRVLKGPGKPDG
jgi:hypothetical protein